MRRATFGAVLGENRLMRSYDSLGFATWGWTPILGLDVAEILEVIATFGENVVALCKLINGNHAIYHSPDSGNTWSKVLEVAEIYDITSVGYNWTLASTSEGWYSSLTSGSSWDLVCAAGVGVPVGKSVVWVLPDHLFTHTGSEIWLSDDKANEGSWDLVCDLTAISGYLPTKFNSIDGHQGHVLSTCGYALVNTIDLGDNWSALDLATVIRDWNYVQAAQPIWRQVAFWDTEDARDPSKSQWMLSALLGNMDIIRTYINRGTGIFSPIVDMALSERHRLNISHARRMGADITDTSLIISGDRRVGSELRHAMCLSSDGIAFNDVLGGTRNNLARASIPAMDRAHATLSAMARLQ
jgi:hypothetical protein